MSTASSAPAPGLSTRAWIERHLKPHVTPYHLAIAGALGGVTVVFIVLVGVLLLIATNFNLLAAIE